MAVPPCLRCRLLTINTKRVTMLTPYVPGDWVEHPDQPDWGPGQVQSAVGARVTVNFQQAGKRMINAEQVPLRPIRPPAD